MSVTPGDVVSFQLLFPTSHHASGEENGVEQFVSSVAHYLAAWWLDQIDFHT